MNGFTEYRVLMRGARSTAGSPLRDEPPLEDLAGHSLPYDEVLRFTTGDGQPPVLVQSIPGDGAIQVDTDHVVLSFNEPVQSGSFNVTLKSGSTVYPVTSTWNSQGDEVTLTRTGELDSNRLFDVEIARWAPGPRAATQP